MIQRAYSLTKISVPTSVMNGGGSGRTKKMNMDDANRMEPMMENGRVKPGKSLDVYYYAIFIDLITNY